MLRKLSPGKHKISLTVRDDHSSEATAARIVIVKPVMDPMKL